MTVATGFSGVANSPTSSSESAVFRVITSRVAGKTVLGEIAVTFGLEAHGSLGYSNKECANDVGVRHLRKCLPAKPLCVEWPVESPGHNQGIGTFYWLKSRSIYARAIHHQGESR